MVRRALARVSLSLLLCLQLVGFAVAPAPGKASDLAALSRAVGYSVTLCRHGDDGSSRHDRSGHGDCCQLALCQAAHQDFALVPTIVAPAPLAWFSSRSNSPTAATAAVPTGPPFAGAVSPRGPPSFI